MRPKIYVLVGLPGSGKTTWLEQHGFPALSSDQVRRLLTGNEEAQNINRLVFATMRHLLRQRVKAGAAATYIDSTALTQWERRCWVRFAELHDCDIEAVFFDTPLAVCLKQNAMRQRVVPAEAIEAMAKRMVEPSVAEGFQGVSIVRKT